MLEQINFALDKLDKSFMLSFKEVLDETHNLNISLKDIESGLNNKDLSKSDITTVVKKIERLSIKNEYKLNLIKDFPEYISYKIKKK
tara:strand:- start:1162 stop:1422 length:261 start_codon:yes stop_codon:yes gene_type:complete